MATALAVVAISEMGVQVLPPDHAGTTGSLSTRRRSSTSAVFAISACRSWKYHRINQHKLMTEASRKWGRRPRRPVPDMTADCDAVMAKIRAQSIVDPFTGCWVWQKHRNSLGYGTTSWRGRPWQTTRLVLAATKGAFDPDLDVCHSCHNRPCVNPDHIRADEHQANLMDGSRDGRLQGQWKTHCKRGHPLIPENLDPKRRWRHCILCDKIRRSSPEGRARAVERNRRYRQKKLSR